MPHDAIATCPICGGELAVTRLHCRSCATTLEGDFNVGRFARLSREQFALLESFLRSKGNLKEMERELGLSYPTVRARVEALLRALGLGDDAAVEDLPPESTPQFGGRRHGCPGRGRGPARSWSASRGATSTPSRPRLSFARWPMGYLVCGPVGTGKTFWPSVTPARLASPA